MNHGVNMVNTNTTLLVRDPDVATVQSLFESAVYTKLCVVYERP